MVSTSSMFSTTELRTSFKIDMTNSCMLELKELVSVRKAVVNDVIYWKGNPHPWRTGQDKTQIYDIEVIAYEENMMRKVQEEDAVVDFDATKLRSKGISVSFLFAFTCEFDLWEWKTVDVVKYLFKPITARYGRCRFADLDCVSPYIGDATVFMSHCWGGRWGDLVAGACSGARVDRFVWIDAFAVRQWPGNSCDLNFRGVIKLCNAVLVAISPQPGDISEREFTEDEAREFMLTEQYRAMSSVIPFSRLWCIVELYAGIEYDKAISIKCSTFAPFQQTSDFCVSIGVSDSEALLLVNYSNMVDVAGSVSALPEDKERELGIIGESGMKKVNQRVSQALMTGYTALRVAVSEVDAYMCGECEAVDQLPAERVQDVLRAACGMGQLDVVSLLIARHGPPHIDELGRLLAASAFTGHSAVVERFLELEGADVNMKLSSGGHTPLLAAVESGKLDTVRMLLSHGAAVDRANDRGMTAMLRAVEEGYMEVLQLLVKHGADPDQARISDGLTPLICALVMNNLDITKELLKSADVNKTLLNKCTPLLIAAQGGHIEAVGLLLEHGAVDVVNEGMRGISALSLATQNGHTQVVALLTYHAHTSEGVASPSSQS